MILVIPDPEYRVVLLLFSKFLGARIVGVCASWFLLALKDIIGFVSLALFTIEGGLEFWITIYPIAPILRYWCGIS